MVQAMAALRCSILAPSSPSQFLLHALGRYPPMSSILPKRITNSYLCISASARSSLPSPSPPTSTDFHLYNTLTKKKERFRTIEDGKVGMYVCGITAYDFSHIGHARASVVFDVLHRYLKHLNYEVIYVRNFTDVDDKIIARATELGEDPLTLSSRYCVEFQSDMAHLHCLPPSVEPRVSTHMSQIIDMIKQILVNGFAYSCGGDVYFSVDKYPSYGQLSGRRLEDNQPGHRVTVDSRKKNPADFALWKSSKAGEPYWDSPWGPGRPGWHIECSAMSAAYLGYSFDIHGGGMDLVFPHHENELAQSCCTCKESKVSYWVHNGFVDVESEKMSKSLGNFITIRQVIDLYHPLALRLFLIGTHYRSTISYSIAQLETASDRLYYIYQTICESDNLLKDFNGENSKKDSIPKDASDCLNKFRFDFDKSLADDLHTPIALVSFSEPLKIINDLFNTRKHLRMESLMVLSTEIKDKLDILGLKPSSFSQALFQLREKALKRAGLTEEQVLQKIQQRSSARKAKLYETSDEIRKAMAAVGIALMDSPAETTWRPAVPLHIQELLAPPRC